MSPSFTFCFNNSKPCPNHEPFNCDKDEPADKNGKGKKNSKQRVGRDYNDSQNRRRSARAQSPEEKRERGNRRQIILLDFSTTAAVTVVNMISVKEQAGARWTWRTGIRFLTPLPRLL